MFNLYVILGQIDSIQEKEAKSWRKIMTNKRRMEKILVIDDEPDITFSLK
jgi:hypothetical protein